MEILIGNVQSLTETVRVLVDVFRESQNIQLHQAQEEAVESTPTRQPRSTGRLWSSSLAANQRSNLTNWRNVKDQQRDQEYRLGRERSRSHDNKTTHSRAAAPPTAPKIYYSDQYRRDTVNMHESTTSMFNRLTWAGTSRYWVQDRVVDKSTKEEKDNQNKLDHLQRQLDLLVSQRYGLEQVGAVDPPFTVIMAIPYLARFKIPSVTPYDGSTDADEHLENY
ncbi:hypothetical protein TIFTF001_038334 [Ficus carica]|uniref:Uncharacterized protein n=1 Tax=Ficus carica TaxID=3494 RepID=A0AA88E7X6_FICCA|nr:hypothetical protein TIFTF001_038334 [Ficus carica]